jgi:hypothetical protein
VVLDGEREVLVASAEVEVGIAPSMELGATAEGLTSAKMVSGLSGVVDENDGEMELALKLAQVTEDRGDLGGEVLVDSVKPDEGVEEKEPRPEAVNGINEAFLVELGVEPKRRRGDRVDIELGEIELEMGADTFEASADDVQGVFGSVEEDSAFARDGKVSQARRAGGDGDGHIEDEEALATLGFASDDADGLVGPEALDEPSSFGRSGVELVSALDRQRIHERAGR